MAEMMVAIFLFDTVYDLWGVIGDEVDFCELDEVDSEDEHSVLYVGGLVIRGKDPIIVAGEAVLAANHDVVASVDCVLITDHDVVVLDQVVAHLLQEVGHTKHLLVNQATHSATLGWLAH